MNLIVIILVAVSLSMDAFSLSLAYGTLGLDKKNIYKLSIIVGVYHFFMPLLGMNFGNIILKIFMVNPKLIVFIVLLIIGIQMIIETFKENENIKIMNLLELLSFGLAVSIDSFSIGIGIKAITNVPFFSFLIFSLSSFLFTYLGLIIGKKANDIIGKMSTIIGGSILIIIGIFYLF